MCYTLTVYRDQQIWHVWATALQRRGLKDWASTFLDAVGPLSTLGAQILYIGEPWIKHTLPEAHLTALINMLDDPVETRKFAAYLREDLED